MFVFSACSKGEDGVHKAVKERFLSFAEAYYNYCLPDALPFCVPELQQKILFQISNTQREDIAIRNADHTLAVIEGLSVRQDNDSTITLGCLIKNAWLSDSIGGVVRKSDLRDLSFTLCKRKGEWYIKKVDQRQSEK